MTRSTPAFISSSFRIFDLSLGEMLWSRRTVFMALVVGGPVLVATLIRVLTELGVPTFRIQGVAAGGASIFGVLIWVVYLRFAVPVLAVFYGTALIADEVEDKTLTYLFTRPIPRGAVLLGKYLAYLACTTLVVLPSVILVYFLVATLGGGSIGSTFLALLIDLGLLGLGLAVYGGVFAFVGAQLKRPLVVGLVFLFGWEPAVLAFPGYLKKFTVAYYLQALVPHAITQDSLVSMLQSIFRDVPSTWSALSWLGAILVVSLLLAVRSVDRREYVLEQ